MPSDKSVIASKDLEWRLAKIQAWLTDLLRLYTPPLGLEMESLPVKITLMAEAVNGWIPLLPMDQMDDRLQAYQRAIVKGHDKTTWPTVPALGAFIASCNKRYAEAEAETESADVEPNPHFQSVRVAAMRMNEGLPVGDSWLYGRLCIDLYQSGLVHDFQTKLRQYRSALYFSAKDILGQEQAERYEAGFVDRHEEAKKIFTESVDANK